MESDDEKNFYSSDEDVTATQLPFTPITSDRVIMAEFCDGYSFRNLFEYLKGCNSDGELRFTEKRIIYEKTDMDETILNKAVIFTSELTQYTFNTKNKELRINVNLSELRSITKSIGKKDSVRIYILKEDEQTLYVQIVSHTQKLNSGDGGSNIVYLQPVGRVEKYDVGGTYNPEDVPNCRIPTLQFSKMCTCMHSVKSNYLRIRGYERGVLFEGMKDGDIIIRVDPYGETDAAGNTKGSVPVETTPTPEISRTNVKINIIKNLSKFNNLSPNGIVKIYFGKDSPVKLSCNIGTYGRLKVFLQNFSAT